MLTISKPISASQAQEYHRAEFANAKDNYYTEEDRVRGEWHGRLAERWGLKGEVNEAHFARLSEGQHPHTGDQLVHHQTPREYLRPDGEQVRTMEHRAGWDATFSAPKSVSLTALPGGDERILAAHRESVGIALDKMERYVQARIGGTLPAETTGEWIAARFEHDSSRPVNGYSAPQLHTRAVIFNITETPDGVSHALQPQELFRTQRYATAVYRAELAVRLQDLGYEIERGEHGSPEIKGYSREYLEASSPRRTQIEKHMEEHNVSGAEAAQIAAYQTREKKQDQSREEVLAQHQVMAEKYGSQPQKVVARAQQSENSERVERITPESAEKAIQTAVNRNMERDAVVDERAILADALRHGMGSLHADEAQAEFAKSIEAGHLIEVSARPGSAGHAFTTPEMKELEADVLRHWSEGRDKHPSLAPDSIQNAALASHAHLNESQQSVVRAILNNRDQVMGLEGAAGTGKTTALEAVCDAAKQAGFEVEGLAPTSRAAQNLESAGIETKTMARHLTEGQRETSGSPCLYIVDESSMASTRQMHDFLKSIHEEDRVLFVGDTPRLRQEAFGICISNTANQNGNSKGAAPMKSNADTTQQQPQRQTAQEAITANVQALIDQLEQGRSETLTAYLSAMARFHRYSFGNILSIAHHRPDATHVAGFHTWNELGRHVTKGQRGIPIQAPMIGSRRQRDEKPADRGDKPAPRLIGFRTVYVFDIAQTEGAELPQPATVSGEVGGHRDRLVEFVAQQGIELEYNERIAPAQGVSYGGKIALLPGQSNAEEFVTLVHELAHEMLHRAERRATTTKTVRETEAEAVAFIVSRAVGLNTGSASADYIGLYAGNAELLTESLTVIQQASAAILDALFAEEAEQLAQAS